MNSFRIVFFGTPQFAATSLEKLCASGINIVAVVTAPDKPAGRGHHLQSSEVKKLAERKNLPVLQPANLKNPEFVEALRAYKADLQIVVAFRMLPDVVWRMPAYGTYNLHASLLPDYRGAAPINWAIINGEKTTGVTTFKLQHAIDTGSILMQREVAITDHDDAGTLHDKLMEVGAALLVDSVRAIQNGNAKLKPQPEPKQGKEAPKIHKETCKINWNQPAQNVRNFIRGLSPFPGAFTEVYLNGHLENWKIFKSGITSTASTPGQVRQEATSLFVGCSDVELELLEIQVPGKKRVAVSEFLRGFRATQLKIV